MLNCIIVEDQLPAQRILKKYIQDTGGLNLVGCFTDGLEAMHVLSTINVDLMFLDIHLPKISGIDFLKTIKNPPRVILTTAFQDYALESYEYGVVDYLLKPFSFQRFVQAVAKVDDIDNQKTKELTEELVESNKKDIYIKSGYDLIRLITADIVYILSDSDYTELHLDNKKYLSSESLRYWEGVLPSDKFIRVHKSYVINKDKIIKVSGNQIHMVSNITIPIGRVYKNDFTNLLLS